MAYTCSTLTEGFLMKCYFTHFQRLRLEIDGGEISIRIDDFLMKAMKEGVRVVVIPSLAPSTNDPV